MYGTTEAGGNDDFHGVIFKLTPSATVKKWKLKVLHDFCAQENCVDELEPEATLAYQGQSSGVPYDGVSPLYGVIVGGGSNGRGAAFELDQGSSDRRSHYKVL